ncbi:MAG: nucleotide exchange factor GrpE [Acidimicrobiia bacterium]
MTDNPDQSADEVVVAEIVDAEPVDPHALGLELPDDPDEAIEILLQALSEARAEASAYLDDLKRFAADSENFRKRMLRDHAANIERASEHLIQSLLPTLDTFDAALAIVPKTAVEEQMLQGFGRTHAHRLETLGKEGLEIVPTVGEPFDPTVHEAATAPSEGEGQLIVRAELRRGYRLKDRIIRAALVAVDFEEAGVDFEEDSE